MPAPAVLLFVAAGAAFAGQAEDPFEGLPPDGTPFSSDDVDALPVDAQSYPFSGLWAGPGADCSKRPGWDLDSPVSFGPGFFEDFQSRCAILDVAEGEGGVYRLFLYCSSMGQGFASAVDVAPEGDVMQAAYYGDDAVRVFERCPATN